MNEPSGVLHIRREVRSLGPDDPTLAHYADAVVEMQKASEPDPRKDPAGWLYQAAIHGTIEPDPLPTWNQCTHGTWFFVSWHRIFVYYFEEIVRSFVRKLHGAAAAEAWALPYWNYCRGGEYASLPEAFREKTRRDGSPNPLYVEQRNPWINTGSQLLFEQYEAVKALARPRFLGTEEFGGDREEIKQFGSKPGVFEMTPHATVHDAVGGWMSRIKTAAKDPIFWLHHCNIDRIWVEWFAQGGGRENPKEAAWADQPFKFFKPDGQQDSKTSGGVVSTEALQYKYDAVNGVPSGPEPAPRLDSPAPEREVTVSPAADPKVVGASENQVTLSGEATVIPVEIDERARAEVSEASSESDPRRLYLNVENIEVDDHPGTSYGIYVNLPRDADEETRLKHHVGNISFFGAELDREPLKDEPAHNRQVRIEVGPLLRALGGGESYDDGEIEVTVLPLLPEPPAGEEEGLRQLAQEKVESASVRIGRVSLAVDA